MKSLDFCQLNKKFDFKALSKAEKKKFYLQELFYGQAYIKKYLLVLFVLVVVGQSANSSSYLNDKQDLHHQERWIVVVTFTIATIAILISIILSFLKNAHKWIKYQIASLVIGNIATFACVFARFYGLCGRAADSIDIHMLIEGVSMSANGFYMTRFFDLLTPHWYIRIIAPSAYFIGWLISTSQIQGEPGSNLFINCTFGMVNLLLVNWLHASFRWNLFANRIEKDIWNDIHRVILQKVPSPIAVFDIQGQVTYANPEFNKLSENQVDVLFEKICRLKQRQQISDREESSISVEQIFEDIDAESPNKSKSYQYTKQCLFSERVQNLAKLLANAIELLNEQKVDDNDYFVFDGKIPENTNNKEASFEITLSFIIEYQKIVIILRDITDHTQLIAAETSNEHKDKLLASVSHELRTPLNGNLSLIQATLNESNVCETVKKKFLVPAYRSGKLLLHLINDILDLSQIAAKKLRLNFEEQPIKDTILSCFQLLELQAKTKGIEFKLDLPDNIPLFTTDHDRVRQIILNLLGNALKFTFQGGITLKARLIGQGQLEIGVEDTGIGIKPEDLGKLFREFTRIDDPNQITLNTKGVGLGLTIANKLAKRLGPSLTQGGITVTSVYGEGSSFKFTIMDKTKEKDISPKPLSEKPTFTQTEAFNSSLPSIDAVDQTHNHVMRKYFLNVSNLFKKQTTTQEQNQSSSVEYCAFQFEKAQKNILIVDDEPFNILALESFLKYSDITIDTAFNGKIAVDKVKKKLETNEHYDLIFMDCQMPIMNGLEATNVLRSMHNGSYDVPIIGCTAFNSDQTIKQCYSSGMTQVMKKPLSKLEVEKIVKMFL